MTNIILENKVTLPKVILQRNEIQPEGLYVPLGKEEKQNIRNKKHLKPLNETNNAINELKV